MQCNFGAGYLAGKRVSYAEVLGLRFLIYLQEILESLPLLKVNFANLAAFTETQEDLMARTEETNDTPQLVNPETINARSRKR